MVAKKRIAIAISDLRVGGSSQVVFDLVRNLDKDKYDIYLLVFFDEFPTRYAQLQKEKGVHLIFLGKKRTLDLPFLRRLKKTIKTIKPDVIHCHLSAVFYVLLATKWKSHRILYTIHAEPVLDIPSLYQFFVKHHARRGHIRLVGCCDYIAGKARELYGTSCAAIQNGIELPTRLPKEGSDRPFDFVSVGRFVSAKRFDDLIRAFAKVKAIIPEARLALCGYGEMRDEILALIEELSLESSVTVFDEKQDVSFVYDQSKIFCLFSDREGCPITLLEARSRGLACIATDVGGCSGLILDGTNGKLVRPRDIDGQAETMTALLQNPAKLEKFQAASLKLSRETTAQKMTERYQNLYEGKD